MLLQDAEAVSPLLTDFRALRSQMQRQGLFKCNKGYYVFKIASNFALLATAVSMFMLYCDHIWAYIISAFLIGLFWQQSGWLAHDFLHHQVFKSRQANHIFGLLIGDICLVSCHVCCCSPQITHVYMSMYPSLCHLWANNHKVVWTQGFSADWWKGKHNTHHAAPNELEHDSKSPVDPDIDTLPLVAWSVEMLESLPNASHRALVRAQHYFFFPILLFARLSWCQQSVAHAYTMFQVALAVLSLCQTPNVTCNAASSFSTLLSRFQCLLRCSVCA